jgi:phage virion morphogenesis protein
MQIRARIEDGGFSKAMADLMRRTMNLKPAFAEIGSMLQTSAEQRIENEGPGPQGEAWPALSAATVAKRGEDAKMLRDQGHLYASLTYTADRFSVAVGSNKVYAAIQQLGGKAGRGRKVQIPARPYVGISDDDRKEIGEILGGYVMGGVRP